MNTEIKKKLNKNIYIWNSSFGHILKFTELDHYQNNSNTYTIRL